MRLPDRAGHHGVPGRLQVLALPLDRHPGPLRLHGSNRLVGQLVALGEVNAEGGELRLEIAGADPEDHPPAGERVERRHRLGRGKRVAVGGDVEVGLQPEPRGRGSGE